MKRMAGTREARKAWLVLRGPYLIAYLLTLGSVIALPSPTAGWMVWSVLASFTCLALIVGSLSDYMVVAGRSAKLFRPLAMLEVTGLRMMVFIEGSHALWSIFYHESLARASIHAALACLFLGVLANQAWGKGPHSVC